MFVGLVLSICTQKKVKLLFQRQNKSIQSFFFFDSRIMILLLSTSVLVNSIANIYHLFA